jgi:pimeloyl-ACP methyl ester carboxylesterase
LALRAAESRGYTISYEDDGHGPAVVLVNGFASPAAEWRKFGYVDRLVDRYRVLAVDSLGHGRSATPHDGEAYRPRDVAADIVVAMDAAGVERAALWGYSRGGWLVAIVAAEYPDRVSALIAGGWAAAGASPDLGGVRPRTEALLRGDWDSFWAAIGMDVSDEDRRYMEESSDPKALGAVDLGDLNSGYAIDLDRITASAFLYYASEDAADPEFAAEIRLTADALGIESHVLSGNHDHISAFTDAQSVLPVVEAHLHAVGNW